MYNVTLYANRDSLTYFSVWVSFLFVSNCTSSQVQENVDRSGKSELCCFVLDFRWKDFILSPPSMTLAACFFIDAFYHIDGILLFLVFTSYMLEFCFSTNMLIIFYLTLTLGNFDILEYVDWPFTWNSRSFQLLFNQIKHLNKWKDILYPSFLSLFLFWSFCYASAGCLRMSNICL